MKIAAKYYLIYLFLAFACHTAIAQSRTIDSLRNILKIEQDDTGKVNTLNVLSEQLWRKGTYDTSLIYANGAQILADKLEFKRGVATAFRNMGIVYWYQSKYAKALEYHNKALTINQEIGNQIGIASNLSNIGSVYKDQGDYSKALDYYVQALSINQKIGNKERIAANLGNIGIVYKVQGDFPKALDYYLQALKMAEEIGDKSEVAIHCCNIGNIYSDQSDFHKALEYQLKALKIDEEIGNKDHIAVDMSNIGGLYANLGDDSTSLDYNRRALKIAEEIGDINLQGACLDNIGDFYIEQSDFSKALDYYQKALKMAEEIGNKDGIASYLASIGSLYTKTHNYKEAEKYLKNAIDIDDSLGALNELRQAEELLSQLYDTSGQYKLALLYYKKAIDLKDTLFNIDKKNALTRKDLNYQFEKKEAAEKASDDKKEAIQTVIRNSLIGGFALMLLFSFLIFRGYRQKQKDNITITKQKKEVEQKNKEVQDSIVYAKRLQDALLPPMNLIKKYLPESFVLYKPKDIVAGDFYWMERAGDNILIAAADCTGHGVPGALVSVICSNALNRTVKEFHITEPGKILDKVTELVLETFEKSESNVQDGMDISLCYMNTKTNEIQWSGAYNSLWYIQNGKIHEVPADKQPIGKHDKQQPFNTHNLNLQKGDTLYLFTDGYADQFGGPQGKKFKYKQLQDILITNASRTMEEQKTILEGHIDDWKGKLEQVDDLLIIGIRV